MEAIASKSGIWEFGKEFKDKWFKENCEGCYTSKAFGNRIRVAKTGKGWVAQMDVRGWRVPPIPGAYLQDRQGGNSRIGEGLC